MQNLPDKRLCYLPRAEHQHIREGLSFEELNHHSPLDVEVAGEERPACLLSVVSYRCNCSIIMLLLLTATTCLSTCRGCRGRGEVVQSGKPLKGSSQRLGGCRLWEAWKIPSSLLNTVSGSVCLFCFWNANNTRDFWLRKQRFTLGWWQSSAIRSAFSLNVDVTENDVWNVATWR